MSCVTLKAVSVSLQQNVSLLLAVATVVDICQQMSFVTLKAVSVSLKQNASLFLAVAAIDNICQQESCVALKAVSISLYSRMSHYSLQLQLLIIFVSKGVV